jgi:hypothetical protein
LSQLALTPRAKVHREHIEKLLPVANSNESLSIGLSIHEGQQRVFGDGNHNPLILIAENSNGGSIQLEHALLHGPQPPMDNILIVFEDVKRFFEQVWVTSNY